MRAPTDLWTLNTLTRVITTAADTEGRMGAFVQLLSPAGNVPLHMHTREDEAFYIQEGRLTFLVGDRTIEAHPGDFVFAPRGIPHRFTVDSEEARLVVVVTPGGFEGFFAEVGTLATSPRLPDPEPPDLDLLATTAASYGVELLGPPA